MQLPEVVPILQLAVSPVILISGVGLLLLSITNRYGRIIDRVRSLGDGLRKSGRSAHPFVLQQLEILMRRARLLRLSITLGVTAVLCASLLIIGLFLCSLLHLSVSMLVIVMFSACMLALVLSLIYFLLDVNASLTALGLDCDDATDAANRD